MGYTFLPSLLVEKFGVLNTIRFPSEVCLTLLDMAKLVIYTFQSLQRSGSESFSLNITGYVHLNSAIYCKNLP